MASILSSSVHLPVTLHFKLQSSKQHLRTVTATPCSRTNLRPCRATQENTGPATAAAPVATGPPQISLQFLGPGDTPVAEFKLESGTKNLRRAMVDAKVSLYDMYGSLMNCGGGGSCGTCQVEIREGSELLSGRTDAEEKYLKKRPESWRLACQSIVGDKTNGGTLVVRTMPQKK